MLITSPHLLLRVPLGEDAAREGCHSTATQLHMGRRGAALLESTWQLSQIAQCDSSTLETSTMDFFEHTKTHSMCACVCTHVSCMCVDALDYGHLLECITRGYMSSVI